MKLEIQKDLQEFTKDPLLFFCETHIRTYFENFKSHNILQKNIWRLGKL